MKVLFICKANVGRSQIAEAIFNNLSKEHSAFSAGLNPGKWEGKNISSAQNVISCMNEIGYNINNKISKKIKKDMVEQADKVIVIGERDNWPTYLVNNKVEYWEIEDAKELSLEFHRKIRDQIIVKVKELLKIFK